MVGIFVYRAFADNNDHEQLTFIVGGYLWQEEPRKGLEYGIKLVAAYDEESRTNVDKRVTGSQLMFNVGKKLAPDSDV
ncbi:unnamed protein product [Bursaphelenchus xylophilus]|uniref:(pine wood nematode) hypothetical protein n=1 Tax=Bursaphelenchus xylophilus TaxID=6326 RepID=A0A1I7RQD9_BURXY|nr:unnamed protein product [Bursaphelenchus xylophilus]CAG9104425.1 unnamed protein product [Bursaphelenchus xylophilus]